MFCNMAAFGTFFTKKHPSDRESLFNVWVPNKWMGARVKLWIVSGKPVTVATYNASLAQEKFDDILTALDKFN